ncbi:MAG: putative glycoside hydrolase [Candidatus Falkowbacteria bacterium]
MLVYLKTRIKSKKYYILAIILVIMASLFCSNISLANGQKEDFPKVASYYLQPNVPKRDYAGLAKFDLVVLDVDTQTIDPSLFSTLRSLNPDIQTFAYIPSQSVNIEDLSSWARFRNITRDNAEAKNRWLKDSNGDYVYFSNTWPTIKFVDIGKGWSDDLSDLAKNDVMSRGVWDGIFYDMVFANLSWLNNGNIDLNQDGKPDSSASVNAYWQKESNKLIEKTRTKTNAPVIANIDIPETYATKLDGYMMENFPAGWMGAGAWGRLETLYQGRNGQNKLDIINVTAGNRYKQDDYQKMRFGLASTLMGDGYFAYDYGDQNHAQTWWYDEYDVKLGKAKSSPKNLTSNNGNQITSGLWRRDFEKGVAVVNSSNETKTYSFGNEEFTKIKGSQDPRTNDGSRVNYVKLKPKDGVVLLKPFVPTPTIINATFDNGAFIRAFSSSGKKVMNGFFAYQDGFAGDVSIFQGDIDADGQSETIVNGKGKVEVFKGKKKIGSFAPYGVNFKKSISFAVADINNDNIKEIITGPGAGGGPQVKIYSIKGKELSGGFFAYDKKFRGGVTVAASDINGDGKIEIITGPGDGGAPEVKVFDLKGKAIRKSVFVYDKAYRSGVSVATGDVNGDNIPEIIVSPIKGGPQVKVFNRDFRLLDQFFAYDKQQRSRIRVLASDINKDGTDEILVGTVNFIQ